jgi:hypothetical protein
MPPQQDVPLAPGNPSPPAGPGDHTALLHGVEDRIEQDLKTHSYAALFQELQQLRTLDKSSNTDFSNDLKDINDKLHKDGLLPGLQIVESPNQPGWFDLQATGPQDQPVPPQTPPPSGYDNSGGNTGGGGGTGGGRSSGFGGDIGGFRGGPSEGSNLPASGPGAFNNYDGNPGDMSPDEQAAEQMAEQDQGQSMWTNFPAASAEEGCAASVSQVLDNAGVAHLTPAMGDALVSQMQADLMKQGWTVTDKPQPGDVVCGYGGLSSAHCGIVGKNGMVFDNHSSTGKWSTDNLSYFSNWNKVVFLHPPDQKKA